MQLTQFTDYSLRVLMYLARLPKPGMATIPEIAEFHRISRNHLVKVVTALTNHGLVMTTRGKGGGIRLGRPAHTIGIGEVIRLTEPHMNLVECFDVKTCECRISRDCQLKAILFEAKQAFMAAVDRYALSDAAGRGFDLTAMLTDKASSGQIDSARSDENSRQYKPGA